MSDGEVTGSSVVPRGRPKTSGTTESFGLPNKGFFSQSTTALAANTDRYFPLYVTTPIVFTSINFEVTTTPATNSNVEIGIYNADLNQQPVGGPIYDSGNISVANGFTGIKTVSGTSISLQPGTYLIAINCSVAMTLRELNSPSSFINSSLGTNALGRGFTIARAYAAFPNPGSLWTATDVNNSGEVNYIFFTWNE